MAAGSSTRRIPVPPQEECESAHSAAVAHRTSTPCRSSIASYDPCTTRASLESSSAVLAKLLFLPDKATTTMNFHHGMESSSEIFSRYGMSWRISYIVRSHCARGETSSAGFSTRAHVERRCRTRTLPDRLYIVAIAHGSREPGYWRSRVHDR